MGKVLFIAGYGRSGSTILDIVLGNHPEITSAGEISLFLEDISDTGRRCSCGRPYNECEFWGKFVSMDIDIKSLAKLIRKVEKINYLPLLMLGALSGKEKEEYRSFQSGLLDYIRTQTGKETVVDSSKSARYTVGRLLALSKLAGQDMYIIHLVRSGWATMESLLLTGRNWSIEGCACPSRWPTIRSVLGWMSANIWATILGRLVGTNRYIRIHYEDFVKDPVKVLESIGNFCNFDVGPLKRRIEEDAGFQVGHMVGGNRIRFQGKLRIREEGGVRRGEGLKLHQRVLFAVLAWWLQKSYGYD